MKMKIKMCVCVLCVCVSECELALAVVVTARLTHSFGFFSLGIEDRKLKLGAHLTFRAAD